jgi:HAD superfamily hydrolase (TIGR01509 family)
MARQGILLDIDGTLLLSNEAHACAWRDALAEYGYTVSVERARRLIGMGRDKVLPELVPALGEESEPGKSIARRRAEIFKSRYAAGLQPAPGARPLLERLRADGWRLVVATSAQEDELRVLLNAAGIADLIEETTSSGEAEESKPAPDIVQAALRKSGLRAAEALMLGATPYDAQAAASAGVGFVGVRCGGWSDAAFRGALAVYDDPAALLAVYDASPLAR